jgi:hypothetical protein
MAGQFLVLLGLLLCLLEFNTQRNFQKLNDSRKPSLGNTGSDGRHLSALIDSQVCSVCKLLSDRTIFRPTSHFFPRGSRFVTPVFRSFQFSTPPKCKDQAKRLLQGGHELSHPTYRVKLWSTLSVHRKCLRQASDGSHDELTLLVLREIITRPTEPRKVITIEEEKGLLGKEVGVSNWFGKAVTFWCLRASQKSHKTGLMRLQMPLQIIRFFCT